LSSSLLEKYVDIACHCAMRFEEYTVFAWNFPGCHKKVCGRNSSKYSQQTIWS